MGITIGDVKFHLQSYRVVISIILQLPSIKTLVFFFSGLGKVGFTFKGAVLSNNSLVTLDDVGEGEDALRCMTDNISCCRPPYTQSLSQSALGNWFFPNGTRVPSSGTRWEFHRTRGDMAVLLHKRRGGVDGVYYCKVPAVYTPMYVVCSLPSLSGTLQ